MLARIKCHFAVHWRDTGYELLTHTPEDVDIIGHSNKSEEDKCLDMLKRWVETDVNASYSKLIDALHEYKLDTATEEIEDELKSIPVTVATGVDQNTTGTAIAISLSRYWYVHYITIATSYYNSYIV